MSIKYNGGYIPAVGADGTTLVANSASATGVAWAGPTFAAGKNKIINGDFGIWQRGTSFSNPGSFAMTADRYRVIFDGSGATRTISQQAFDYSASPAADKLPIAGYPSNYFYRFAQSVAGSGGSFNIMGSQIEDVRTFAGQTVTLSFWVKAAATTVLPFIDIIQNFGTGGSSSVTNTFASNVSVGTSWTRVTYTAAIPSISGKTIGSTPQIEMRVWMPINATFTVDTWGWQLEAGSVATPFTTATGTFSGELAACQRYYQRVTPASYGYISNAGTATNTGNIIVPFPAVVTFRTIPTSVDYANLGMSADDATVQAVTAVTIKTSVSQLVMLGATTSSTLTQYRPYFLSGNNNATQYLGLSAEL